MEIVSNALPSFLRCSSRFRVYSGALKLLITKENSLCVLNSIKQNSQEAPVQWFLCSCLALSSLQCAEAFLLCFLIPFLHKFRFCSTSPTQRAHPVHCSYAFTPGEIRRKVTENTPAFYFPPTVAFHCEVPHLHLIETLRQYAIVQNLRLETIWRMQFATTNLKTVGGSHTHHMLAARQRRTTEF